jgi:Trk K+ transport system NAD-binding subunit/nucleotide-binding universal stress UspA family protein
MAETESVAPVPETEKESAEGRTRRRVLIIGAGQTGRALARALSESWDIVVMDPDAERLERLRRELPERSLRPCPKDGTSLLNLKEAGVEGAEWLVAVTGKDEVNIEACRIAVDVSDPPRMIGVVRRPEHRDEMKATGAEVVVRPDALAGLIKNRIERAHQVASGVGLGQGEIVEIPVLRSSPAVDTRVQDLRARRWVVAAIYRDERYVVPHGHVVIREGDRLLLTGEPESLPYIADYLRAGIARFPLQYGGRTVVVSRGRGRMPESFWDEVKYLAERTRSREVRVLHEESDRPPELALGRTKLETQMVDDTDDLAALVRREVHRLDVGCLVIPKEPVGFWSRVGLTRPAFADVLDLLACPLLLAAGSSSYRRILLPVLEPDPSILAAELAIDLARQMDIGITAVVLTPPSFVVGQDAVDRQREALRTVMEIGSLYHMKLDPIVREGNPPKELARIAAEGDLVVVAVRAGRRASLFNPNAALQILYRARSSVLALPHRERVHGTL